MKLTPSGPAPRQVPFGVGGMVVAKTGNSYSARQNTPPSKASETLLQKQMRRRFQFAGRMAANPSMTQLETAEFLAQGSEQVPRDILTMAALGRYYVFEFDNGLTARHVRTPTVTDPKAYRAAALYSFRPKLPWQGVYLGIGAGWRLKL